jgi:NitT/TauT family transport system substrate-binding protein
MSHYRLLAAAFAAGAALVAAVAPASALDKVRTGTSGVAIIWTTLDAGTEAGIWKKHGIEVQTISFAGDAKTQQALTADEIDFGFGSGPGLGYRAKGVPAIGVAAVAGPPLSFAIVVPMNSPIKTVADLKGKSLGVTTAGSMTSWLVREISRKEGWGTDGIHDLALGSDRARLAAMKNGDIDGSVNGAVNGYSYEEHNEAKVVLLLGDVVTIFHTHVLFASDKLIANNPDLVKRFLQGFFESAAYMKAHPEFGIKNAAKVLNMSETAVARGYPNEMRMLSDDGAFDPAAVEAIRHSLVDLGIVETMPEARSMYSDRFVPVKLDPVVQ